MPRLVRCIEGHVFDAQASTQCPLCGAAVELAPAESDVVSAAGTGAPIFPVANRAPLLWAIAGLGLGLIAAATVVFVRSDVSSGPAAQSAAPAAPDQVQAAHNQTAATNTAVSNSSDREQSSVSPAPQAPTDAPAQADQQQADLQPLNGPASDNSTPLSRPSNAPLDGDAFKAGFGDVLSKLGSLAQIDPVVANIATGIAGLNLFNHGEEQAGQAMLQQAAAANVSFAAAALGQQYFGGTKTLRQDYGQASHWFELASHTGDVPVANYELAVIYARGLAGQKDLKLAGRYFLAAYHDGFQPVVEIVAAARAGQRPQRELLRKLGLDPARMGMTLLEYYDARHASDPAGALQMIEQLANGGQWPAANILAMAQWNGDNGAPDRAAAVKNFLAAASGGAFAALIPVSEASLDDTLGSPNPTRAGLVAALGRLYSKQQTSENLEKLDRVYRDALDKASPEQHAQLDKLDDLLSQIAPPGSEASAVAEPALSNP
jgi:TPR repeat protein